MKVYILEDAFWSMLLSTIEVYPRECLGLLIGTYDVKNFIVHKSVVFQTAERYMQSVNFPKDRVHDEVVGFLKKHLPYLKTIGDFHSHTGEEYFRPSKTDMKAMEEKQAYIIIQAYKKKKTVQWQYNKSKTILFGTSGNYHFKIGAWFKNKFFEKFRLAELSCPYAIGMTESEAFE
ncbi:MAG: Mov34/MPN/PAD-1 family protein [Armatimonadota bacterium]